jgi:iron-sulfur cluster assembly protein/iron-sulfur cluster insertion protein
MRASKAAAEANLRIFVEQGGCSGMQYGMSFDAPKEGDSRFESEGVAILVDPASLSFLQGSKVDFDDGLHGKGFEIKNPNARENCGCGKSFN